MTPEGKTSSPMEPVKKKRTLRYITADKLHPSRILPEREVDSELAKSVKAHGIQQPIIVRPSLYEEGCYEIIDGHGRSKCRTGDQKVLVDVRYDLDNSAVFKISDATFKRKSRNSFERAKFYNSWVKTEATTKGNRGAQTRIATAAGLSQAEISHYMSISDLFDRLQAQEIQERIFNVLKNQAVNKLYALSSVDDKYALVKIATIIADEPDITVQRVRSLIEDETGFERELERELDMEGETEVDRNRWEFQLRKATEDLAGTLKQTDETLTTLNTSVMNSPRRFFSYEIVKRIQNVLKALKKIEKEASKIINSTTTTQKEEGEDGAEG